MFKDAEYKVKKSLNCSVISEDLCAKKDTLPALVGCAHILSDGYGKTRNYFSEKVLSLSL